MYVVEWEHGRVSIRDSVAVAKAFSGAHLRDEFTSSMPVLTLGLVRFQANALKLGPIELLRFGEPVVTRNAVEWPIEGGLLAGGRGGRWRIQSSARRVEASVGGFAPRLPRAIYALTHEHVHLLYTRLFLGRLHGRDTLPGEQATSSDRAAAATVDAALCFTLARFVGRRTPKRLLTVAAVYHVVCWTVSGRTLGGAVMRQRVVAVDGSRLLAQQAALRFLLLPLSWIAWRPLHDRIAGSVVIKDR
jgi:hypothetical protein